MSNKTRLLADAALTSVGVLAVLAIQTLTAGQAVPQDPASQAEQDPHAQHGAVEAMSGAHREHGARNAHMKLTTVRPLTDADMRRAQAIVETLRSSLEKYKDSKVALKDGYQPFLARLPLPEYHFTNYRYGFLEALTFDPQRPTSLLYRKTRNGYELVGAMYTAPKRFTADQLHARIPLGVATWHAHVNICMPARNVTKPDWSRFGLRGAIATSEGCEQAGGRFFPQLFGWMVHVYPYEHDASRIGRTARGATKGASNEERRPGLRPLLGGLRRSFVTALTLRLERERRAVHAVPEAGGARTVFEDVSKMATASRAVHLGPHHPKLPVD